MRPLLAFGLLLLACGGRTEGDGQPRGAAGPEEVGSEGVGAEDEGAQQGNDPDGEATLPPQAVPPDPVPQPMNTPVGPGPGDPPVPPPGAMTPAPPEPMTPGSEPTPPPEPFVCEPSAPVSEVEIARRLTQLFWDTDSTEGLVGFDTNDLSSSTARVALAGQMLEDPKAAKGPVRFVRRWLGLQKAAPEGVEPEVWAGIQKSTDETVAWMVNHKAPGPLGFLQGADVVVTAEAAPFYRAEEAGAEIPAPGSHQFAERSAGLLTQTEWLMSYSNPSTRGAALQASLGCMPAPPKPSGAIITPIVPEAGETTREAYGRHLAHPTCVACHSLVDPAGFLFEHFDAQSYFRSMENSKPVDTSGAFPRGEPLGGAADLPQQLGSETLTCAAVLTLGALSSGNSECLSEDTERLGQLEDVRLDAWLVELVSTPSFVAE